MAARFLTGFFFLAGIAALVVGVHDVRLSEGRFGVLFPGVLLVLAGILFVGAVWRLIPIARPRIWQKGERRCKEPMPAAFLVSMLLGVYIFFGAQTGAGTQRAIVTGVSLLFMATGFLGFVLFWGEIKVSTARVSAGVALTVVGLAIGAWEFWYQNQYLPSHLDRAVSVQVALTKLRTQGGYDLLSATLGYQDIGSRAVLVLGSAYTLTGSTVIACPRQETPERETKLLKGQLPDPQRTRFMSPVWEVLPPTLLAAGRFAPEGRQLAPNAPASRQLIFYVPHDSYQLLRLRAQVFAVSASVPLATQKPVIAKSRLIGDKDLPKTDNELYDLWPLRDSGWFQKLLSGSRGWVVTRYEIVNPDAKAKSPASDPDLRVVARFPNPSWSANQPTGADIEKLFGPSQPLSETETFSDAELPLKPVTTPTAREIKKANAPCEPEHPATKQNASPGR